MTNFHDAAAEMFHQGMHAAQSQIHDIRLVKYGHVSTYDPKNHAVKVIIPQDSSVDDDTACETEFIPLGTMFIGDKWGLQFAPKGGATQDDPFQGELVAIHTIQRSTGLFKAAHLVFNENMMPPGGGEEPSNDDPPPEEQENTEGWDDDPKGRNQLKGGEFVLRLEKGTFLKGYEDGSFQIFAKKDLHIYVKEEANLVVREGDLNVTVEKGDMNVTLDKGDANMTLTEGDLSVSVELGDTSINTTAGDTTITSEIGSIAIQTTEGDIAIEATGGTVAINAGLDITVIAEGLINLIAPIVNAGLDAAGFQKLCNEAFLLAYNNHIHTAPGGVTSPPTMPAVPDIETTISFAAS